ncbi:MAG: aldehyde dehydrogenase family protein, partial [Hyphomicrobiales bacterium]|nr:aldehyde dehydrogenase family protein [Hyphomicrobiales bacterium]
IDAEDVKPSEDACLSVIKLATQAEEVGVPSGALNVVTGPGAEAAPSAHPNVDFISFAGSLEVSALVQEASTWPRAGFARGALQRTGERRP